MTTVFFWLCFFRLDDLADGSPIEIGQGPGKIQKLSVHQGLDPHRQSPCGKVKLCFLFLAVEHRLPKSHTENPRETQGNRAKENHANAPFLHHSIGRPHSLSVWPQRPRSVREVRGHQLRFLFWREK